MVESRGAAVRPLQRLTRIGVLSALALLFMFLEVRTFIFPDFLKYDPSEIPALLGTFSLGPLAGVLIEAIKCILYFLSPKNASSWVGPLANFIAGGSYVFFAGLVYRGRRTRSGAILGLVVGSVAMVIATALANYFVLLGAWGIPAANRWPLILTAMVPFNLLKAVVSGLLTFVIYKKVRTSLHL